MYSEGALRLPAPTLMGRSPNLPDRGLTIVAADEDLRTGAGCARASISLLAAELKR